jgi:uncharacterized protein YaeQ
MLYVKSPLNAHPSSDIDSSRGTVIHTAMHCRICHEEGGVQKTLCNCRGDQGCVHLKCVVKWAKQCGNKRSGKSPWVFCEICGSKYGPKLANDITNEWIKHTRARGEKTLEELVALFYKSSILSESGYRKRAMNLRMRILSDLPDANGSRCEKTAMRKMVQAAVFHERGFKNKSHKMTVDALASVGSDALAFFKTCADDDSPKMWHELATSNSQNTHEWIQSAGKCAHFLQKNARYAECVEVLERLCCQAELVLGPENKHTATHNRNLAVAYMCNSQNMESEVQMRVVVEKKRNIYGPDHHQTISAMLDLVEILHRRKRFEECLVWMEKIAETRARCLGARSVLSTGSFFFVCMFYIANKKLEAAEKAIASLQASAHHPFKTLGRFLHTKMATQEYPELQNLALSVCQKFMLKLEANNYTASAMRELERYILGTK